MTPGLAVAKKVVTLPPGGLTALLLVPMILGASASAFEGAALLGRGLNWLFLATWIVWAWSIYRVSKAALVNSTDKGWIDWMFAAPLLVDTIASVANLSMRNSFPAVLFFAALLFCVGQAANALEDADPGQSAGWLGKMLGTALWIYLAPAGVWVLRQRLLRVAARTA